jgi:predicted CXXCH cytochrome family protein
VGITCSDCHDPHAANVRLPGDTVCYQCHPSDRYATKEHHFHAEGSAGVSCVECHMPPSNYGVVDARHDHNRKAIKLQPRFVPAYVNMAQLLSVEKPFRDENLLERIDMAAAAELARQRPRGVGGRVCAVLMGFVPQPINIDRLACCS